MKSVWFIFTVHEERELANVDQLHTILERHQPEVIFLEVPPGAFDRFYGEATEANLESLAVRKYRERHQVELVPIDLPTPEASFFSDYKSLLQRIDGKSSDYRRLTLWHKNYMQDYGFDYLNSEHCSKIMSDIYTEIWSALPTLDDPRLSDIFELWNKTNELRDQEMMKRIRKYCGEHSFEKSVFLVGAAHRQSIIDKSKETDGDNPTRIQWDFYGNDDSTKQGCE